MKSTEGSERSSPTLKLPHEPVNIHCQFQMLSIYILEVTTKSLNIQILITKHMTLMNHENAHYTEEKMIFGKGVLCHKVSHRAAGNPPKFHQKCYNAGVSNATHERMTRMAGDKCQTRFDVGERLVTRKL